MTSISDATSAADAELIAHLAQIKVGDTIMVAQVSWPSEGPRSHTVTRAAKKWLNAKWTEYRSDPDWTPTRFSRDDGLQIGETATRHRIVVGASLRAAENEAQRFKLYWTLLETKFDITQPDILKLRALGDEAEALLRESGEWEEVTDAR